VVRSARDLPHFTERLPGQLLQHEGGFARDRHLVDLDSNFDAFFCTKRAILREAREAKSNENTDLYESTVGLEECISTQYANPRACGCTFTQSLIPPSIRNLSSAWVFIRLCWLLLQIGLCSGQLLLWHVRFCRPSQGRTPQPTENLRNNETYHTHCK